MKRIDYEDSEGRKSVVMLPDDMPDAMAAAGAIVGPPSLASLELPKELEIRLHNELFNRGLITARDVRMGRQQVEAALRSLFALDVGRIIDLYSIDGQSL